MNIELRAGRSASAQCWWKTPAVAREYGSPQTAFDDLRRMIVEDPDYSLGLT